MSEWKEKRLEDLTKLIIDCPHSTPKWKNDGVIVLRTQNIRNGRLDLSSPSYTDEDGYQSRIKRAIPSANDIVLTREAPMGEVCLVPENLKCCLGQRVVLIRADEKELKSEFLFYSFQAPYLREQILWNEGTGTTVSNIRIPLIKDFVIKYPSFKEQQEIAKTLSKLDQKITLLRQQNQDLEDLAQTLFKRWFVEFEFPNENGEPYKSSGGKMVASELGEIPEGWRVGKLREIALINPKEIVKKGTEAPYIEMKDLSTSGMAITKTTLRNFSSGSKFRNGDTLLARITPCLENGKTGFVDILENDKVGWGSTEFIVVRGKDVSPEFIYCLCRDKEFRNHSIKNMVGSSGRMRIPNDVVENYALPICAKSVYNMFNELVNPIFSKSKRNRHEIQTLTQLRDTLLPKLLSGELKLTSDENDMAGH